MDQARHARARAPHRRHREAPGTGNIDYRPEVHQEMTNTRVGKVLGVANSIPDQEICLGREGAELAMVGWGSTFGPIHQAVRRALAKGQDVAHVHVRHIWPMPKNMSVLLKGFKHILVPEMNMGQLKTVLRDQFLVDAKSLTKVSGHPFRIAEIEAAIDAMLGAQRMRSRSLNFRDPMSVWSMVILLIVIMLLIYWLRPHG